MPPSPPRSYRPPRRTTRSRKGRSRATSVSSILSSSFSKLGIAARIREHNIKKLWAGCVGEKVAKRSAPTKLLGETLYCAVASSPWAAELVYQKTEIITRINEKLGERALVDIIFKVGPVPGPRPTRRRKPARRNLTNAEKETIEKTASVIEDDALRGFFERVMEKQKT